MSRGCGGVRGTAVRNAGLRELVQEWNFCCIQNMVVILTGPQPWVCVVAEVLVYLGHGGTAELTHKALSETTKPTHLS